MDGKQLRRWVGSKIDGLSLGLAENQLIDPLQHGLVGEQQLQQAEMVGFLELDEVFRPVFLEVVEAGDVVAPDDVLAHLFHTVLEYFLQLVFLIQFAGLEAGQIVLHDAEAGPFLVNFGVVAALASFGLLQTGLPLLWSFSSFREYLEDCVDVDHVAVAHLLLQLLLEPVILAVALVFPHGLDLEGEAVAFGVDAGGAGPRQFLVEGQPVRGRRGDHPVQIFSPGISGSLSIFEPGSFSEDLKFLVPLGELVYLLLVVLIFVGQFLQFDVDGLDLLVLADESLEQLQRFVPEDHDFLLQGVDLVQVHLLAAGVVQRSPPDFLHLLPNFLDVQAVGAQELLLVGLDDGLHSLVDGVHVPHEILVGLEDELFVCLAVAVDLALALLDGGGCHGGLREQSLFGFLLQFADGLEVDGEVGVVLHAVD